MPASVSGDSAFAHKAGDHVAAMQRHPDAWKDDRAHPVRHTFLATIPVSLILLATVAVGLTGAGAVANVLWWAGSLGQLGVTLWVVSRWWNGNKAGGLTTILEKSLGAVAKGGTSNLQAVYEYAEPVKAKALSTWTRPATTR